MLFCRAWLWRK